MGPPTISLNKLALLDRLIETRSVTEAAKALRRSQPSVTAALNDLRAHFDDPLLVREGVGLRPTPFALLLAPDWLRFDAMANVFRSDERHSFRKRRRRTS